MKKFLVSMAISVICFTIGFTSMLFEFHTYEIIEAKNEDVTVTKTIKVKDIMHNDRIEIDLDGSYLYVDIQDDLSQSDEIELTYAEHIETEIKSNRIVMEGHSSNEHSSYRRFRNILDTFIEGLKEHKIYENITDGFSNRIILHCSPELRNKIKITYD